MSRRIKATTIRHFIGDETHIRDDGTHVGYGSTPEKAQYALEEAQRVNLKECFLGKFLFWGEPIENEGAAKDADPRPEAATESLSTDEEMSEELAEKLAELLDDVIDYTEDEEADDEDEDEDVGVGEASETARRYISVHATDQEVRQYASSLSRHELRQELAELGQKIRENDKYLALMRRVNHVSGFEHIQQRLLTRREIFRSFLNN